MSKRMIYVATALVLFAALVGCGGQKPAEQAKPAEPVFTAQVTMVDSMVVASIAKVGPYSDAGKALSELMAWMEKGKITPAGGPFAVYLDDPTKVKPESTRYEVCFPVPAGTKSDKKAGIVVKKVAPLELAVTEYTGPYDKIGATYAKLMQWVGENKYEVAGPMYEFYLNDPAKTPPESLKTRVGILVKAAAPAADTGKKPAEGEKPGRTGR